MSNIVSKFVAVWTRPWDAMRQVKEEGELAGIAPSMLFIVVMGVITGIITAVIQMVVPAAAPVAGPKSLALLSILIVPLLQFVGSFIGAFIVWGLIDGVLKGTAAQYKTSYRMLALLAAFSPVPALLAAIPGNVAGDLTIGQILGILINIWATFVLIRGIIIVRETPPVRTWVTFGTLFVILITLSVFARVAAQRQLAAGNPDFADLTGGDQFDDADLDKQLEELANEAKAEPKK